MPGSPKNDPHATHVPSALDTIRRATRQCHSQLEQEVNWHDAFGSPAGYVQLLRRFQRVVEPLERDLEKWQTFIPADAVDSKSARLRSDITAVESLYHVEQMACVDDRYSPFGSIVVDAVSAWGARYVLEGSALGGQVLSRQLQQSMDAWASAESAASARTDRVLPIDSYFVGRGADTGSYWRAFCEQLNHALQDIDAADRAAWAAVRTFETFHSSLVGKAVCVRS